MPNEELLAHIRTELARGVDKTTLIQSLLGAGWKVEDINAALSGVGPAPSQNIPTAPSAPQLHYGAVPTVPSVKYAGFWVRAAALMVDGLVLGVLQVVNFLVLGSGVLGSVVSVIITWVYAASMVTAYQATLGKMAVGLRVERTNGDRIGFWRALLREISKILSAIILMIGYLMVAWTQKKQGLHDKIADTIVIEKDPTKSKTVWVVLAVLLVFAIPILGIFSSIVLASLNSARMKGNDALVKSELLTVMTQAELYYSGAGNGGYLGYCNSPEALSALAIASKAGTTSTNLATYVCNDSKTAWAASAPLRTTTSYECAASTGAMAEIASPLASGQTSCGPTVSPVQ